jgi:hypothetical protein
MSIFQGIALGLTALGGLPPFGTFLGKGAG